MEEKNNYIKPYVREKIGNNKLKSYQNLSSIMGSRYKGTQTQKSSEANLTKYDFFKKEEEKKSKNNYDSYIKLNKELDEKIANIRQKYIEASDYLGSRVQRSRYETSSKFNTLDDRKEGLFFN